MRMQRFPRLQLAQDMVRALQGDGLFGDDHNGMFLAAPRRTGKTTFLRKDLQPALEAVGAVVVYVDLWADQNRDPAELIARAIGQAMEAYRSKIQLIAQRLGIQGLGVGGWISLDFDNDETSPADARSGLTLPDALRILHQASESPIALIVDEGQQALTSKEGESLMIALKSSRDQLNDPDQTHLMIIMSGSDRDKLLRLTNSQAAPFYGSQITNMPLLGEPFVDHCAKLIEADQPRRAPVDRAVLSKAFAAFGKRPQFFMQALGNALSPLSETAGQFESEVLGEALDQQAADRADMESLYLGLSDLQKVVLWRLLAEKRKFRAYDQDALTFYKQALKDIGSTYKTATASKIQTALEAMRSRTPPLVWKSARGEYAVEDTGMYEWYLDRNRAKTWPPF